MNRFPARIIILVIALSFSTPARTQVIINEDFEKGFLPENWTIMNGTAGENWRWDAYTTWPRSGVHCMISRKRNGIPVNAWVFSPALSLEAGVTYRLSYWYKNQTQVTQMKVTLGSANNIISQNIILHDYPSVLTNSVYLQGIDEFTVPASGNYHFAFNSFNSSTSTLSLAVDDIVLEQITPTACNGNPPNSTALAPATACSSVSFDLNLSGVLTASGLSYQWQSSLPGQNNFSDIPGANTASFTHVQTATTEYRCAVSCNSSGLTTYSTNVIVNTPAVCYCIPPPLSCTSGDVITNVSFGNINNNSACSYSGYTDYTYTIAPTNFMVGTTIPISVSIGNAILNNYVTVWVDYDRSGTFEDSEYKLLGNGKNTAITSTLSAPVNATPGLTRMRVMSNTYSWGPGDECREVVYGEAEDYLINIVPYACTTAPSVGFVTGTNTVCAGDSVVLNFGGGPYTGFSIRWESSAAGANNFSTIAGETSTTLRKVQHFSTDYRCVVTCEASGLFNTSSIKRVNTPELCYCTTPGPCSSHRITRVRFGTLNYSSSCYTAYNEPPPPQYSPSVNAGSMVDLFVTLSSGGNAACWIDFNQNGLFEPGEFTQLTTNIHRTDFYAPILIPQNTVGDTIRMRIRTRETGIYAASDACTPFTGFSGETEDYNIIILPLPIGIGVPEITSTIYEPVLQVNARITQINTGVNTSDTLGPRIWARKYSSGIWKSFKGVLISGTLNDGQWSFPVNHDSLGIRRNGADSVLYYIVAQDLNTPFGLGYQPISSGTNHTDVGRQVTPPSTPLGYRLKPKLKDTVYVSTTQISNLSNENGLFHDINTRTLEGNLTVLIENDLIETGIHSLKGVGLNGFSLSIKPVRDTLFSIDGKFQGDGPPNGSAIRFDSASRVTIDGSHNGVGKYLRFRLNISGFFYVNHASQIKVFNSCDSIFFRNLVFLHSTSTGNLNERTIFIGDGNNKNIHILDNEFSSANINRQATHFIMSTGGNNLAIIKRNKFLNCIHSGIEVLPPSNDWRIDSNHFYRTIIPGGYTSSWYAIRVTGNGHSIHNNYIGGQEPYCGGGYMRFNENPGSNIGGILALNSITGGSPVIITNNRVDNIQTGLTHAARPAAFAGIHSTNSETRIIANIIGNPSNADGSFNIIADYIYGIAASGDKPVEIKDNIVTGLRNQGLPGPSFNHVYMKGISWYSAVDSRAVISGNRIFNLFNSRAAYGIYDEAGVVGLFCRYGFSNIIEKNIIWNIYGGDRLVAGIRVEFSRGNTPTVIQKNRVYNLFNFNTGGIASIQGISAISDNPIDLFNNQVLIDNEGITKYVDIQGIFHNRDHLATGLDHRVIYNTIYIGGYSTGEGVSSAYVGFELPGNYLYNNIFYNDRRGGSNGNFAHRFINYVYGPPPGISGNNNLYILSNPSTFAKFVSDTISWSTWKLNTGLDNNSNLLNSVDVPSEQFFVDKKQGNLNINVNHESSWYVNQKGIAFNFIPGDYDSSTVRSTVTNSVTDIGSDEFNTSTIPPLRLCAGGNASILSPYTGLNYQWQMDSGAGFVNISDGTHYTGTNTISLQLLNIPTSWTTNRFRCLVDGVPSIESIVNIVNVWTGAVGSEWENPANWSCGFIPDENTNVVIYEGTVVLSSNTTIRSLKLGHMTNFTIVGGTILTITH